MRTLALLAALFLLALQAQAEPVPWKAEDALQEQQPGEDDQGTAISLEGAESAGPQHAGRTLVKVCRCKRGSCRAPEAKSGTCYKDGKMARLCCR